MNEAILAKVGIKRWDKLKMYSFEAKDLINGFRLLQSKMGGLNG